MTFIDALRAANCKRHIIADNLLDSINPHASSARHEVNKLWELYQSLAEHDFIARFAREPQEKYWEMYLACALMDIGFQVGRVKEGPDLWIEDDNGRVWIEAIAPGPGNPDNPDYVPEPPLNQVSTTPVRQIVLRITGAIHKKQNKFREYQQRGIVAQSERCVIALSGAKLHYPVTPDYIQRAVYEAGELYIALDPKTLKAVDRGRTHEPQITKHSAPIDKPTFLHTDCSHVAALLFGWRGIANTPSILGSELALFHNHESANPIGRGWLGRGSEYWVEIDDQYIHLKSHPWTP